MPGSNVNVNKGAVSKAMTSCVQGAQEIKSAISNLKNSYAAAGSGWKDSKYKELGEIVEECISALAGPMAQLSDCYSTLEELLAIIEEYESI